MLVFLMNELIGILKRTLEGEHKADQLQSRISAVGGEEEEEETGSRSVGGDGRVERFCSAGESCLNGEQEAQQTEPEQPDPERARRSGSLRIGTKALLFLSQLLRVWGLQQRRRRRSRSPREGGWKSGTLPACRARRRGD